MDPDSRKFPRVLESLLSKSSNSEILIPIINKMKRTDFNVRQYEEDPIIIRMLYDLLDSEKLENTDYVATQYYILGDWYEMFDYLPKPKLYDFD